MADDDSKGSKGKGFLKKSKWGKLFKEDDAGPTLKLSDDVVDFLKPSTESARFATIANPPPAPRGPTAGGGPPKLSIAVAQRFPAANEVVPAAASSNHDGPASPLPPTLFNGQPKRRRGLKLVVGFARTPPDIMGEGGDEAPDPPSEIGRQKAALTRSVSERRVPSEPHPQQQRQDIPPPNPAHSLAAGPYGTSRPPIPAAQQELPRQIPQQVAQQQHPQQTHPAYQPRQYQPQHQTNQAPSNGQAGYGGNGTRDQPDDVRPGPLRRANTSHNEVSPPVQKRTAPPPVGPRHVHKSSLGRVPTGFTAHIQDSPEDPVGPSIIVQDHAEPNEHERPPSRIRPTVDTGMGIGVVKKQYSGLSPTTPISPAALKARTMRTNEGATFRRASMLMLRDEADEDEEGGAGGGSKVQQIDWEQEREKEREAERAAERAAEKERAELMERQKQHEAQSYHQYGQPYGQQPPPPATGNARPRVPTVDVPTNDELGSRSPRTVDSPTEHNPFADPKFLKRSSRETASESLSTSIQGGAASQQRAPSQSSQTQPSSSRPMHSFSRPIQGADAYSSQQQQNQQQRARQPSQGQTLAADPRTHNGSMSSTQDAQRPVLDINRPSPMQSLIQQTRPRVDATIPLYQSQQTQSPDSYYQPSQRPDPRGAAQRSFRGDEGTGYASATAGNVPNAASTQNHPGPRSRQYSEPQQTPARAADGLAIRYGPSGEQNFSSSQHMQVSMGASRSRDPSPTVRDRAYTHNYVTQPQRQQLSVDANGGEYSNDASGRAPHTRTISHDSGPSQRNSPASATLQQPPTVSPRFAHHFAPQPASGSSPRGQTSVSAGQSVKGSSPSLRQQSTEQLPPARSSPMKQMTPTATAAPATSAPQRKASDTSQSQLLSTGRPPLVNQISQEGNPAADAAFADFCARVAHMRGVFSLTAEKEQTRDKSSPSKWLRAAAWWFLKGKAGVEGMMRTVSSQDPGQPRRELLAQPHVDLAKAWWIIMDPLQLANSSDGGPQNASAVALRSALKSVCLMMGRNGLLPPTHALIQGQNTNIWLEYPRFRADVTAILGGDDYGSTPSASVDAFEMMPLGDTRDYFCYGRFQVDAYINTDDPETDRIPLPCMFSIMRSRRDYQMDIAIVTQSDLITVRVSPRTTERRLLSWSDVSWKPNTFGMVVHLPRNLDLNVRLQERDYRYVRGLAEYARGVERDMVENADEKLVYETSLAEVQYSDSANAQAFPSEKLRGCTALIYEHLVEEADGSGRRKKHRGFRFLLTTDVGQKTLSSVTHDLGRNSPIYVELVSDKAASAASGQAILVLRIREESRQCRAIMTFSNAQGRQAFYEALNALAVGPDETIVEKIPLTALNIEPVGGSSSQAATVALQNLQWQKLGVTNFYSDDPNNRLAGTVESESLRILLRHTAGCIVDRLNLSKGEFLLRLPASSSGSNPGNAIQLLRQAQLDMTISIDARGVPQPVSEAMAPLLHAVQQTPTIRTFTFASPADLHAFQASLTGYAVHYDGTASTLAIARRRMVVPIYKKWEASHVRIQVVSKAAHQADGGVTRVLAFFPDGSFSHADALCFRVLGTDVFENVKGSKGAPAAVKLVDAKFSLPHDHGNGSDATEGDFAFPEKVRRRFVNLEGLDYAEEHDDITVGFADEAERDRFSRSLPGATSVSRGLTLKRRI